MKTTYVEMEDGRVLCSKFLPAAEVIKTEGSDSPIVIVLSTGLEDSDGDVVFQRKNKNGPGWQLDRFNGAPLVTWQHDTYTPNLSGPKTWAQVRKHATKGYALHIDPLTFDQGDHFAVTLEGKIRRDVLKEFSAGFMVTHRDTRKNEEGRVTGYDIYGAELIEAAVANRGANPETEVLAKQMLRRAELASKVESSGYAEIEELKEEIVALGETVDLLNKALAALGDKVDGQEHEEAHRVTEHLNKRKIAANDAAKEILAAMRKAGTARTGN